MNQHLNVFLATDYSEAVMNAERYAFGFAKETQSSLTVLHVYELPFSLPLELEERVKALERLKKYETQKLKTHCDMILRSLNIKIQDIKLEYIALKGSIGKEIRKEAEHSHPDLIITGTHGTSNSLSLFQKSHTWDIIKKSNVPILAIPQNALFKNIKKIVFATEYREGEIPGIQSIVKMAARFGAKLVVVHISNHMLEKEFELMVYQRFNSDVRDKVSYENLSFRIVYADDIVKGLNDYCFSSSADWIAMSHAQPFFFETMLIPEKSITKEMSLKTHIPLLCIPDFYETNLDKPDQEMSYVKK